MFKAFLFGHFLSLATLLVLLTVKGLQGAAASMLLLWQPNVLQADLLKEMKSTSNLHQQINTFHFCIFIEPQTIGDCS